MSLFNNRKICVRNKKNKDFPYDHVDYIDFISLRQNMNWIKER